MNIPILMYHQIDVPPPSGTPLRGLVVSPNAFARQMSMLNLLGYTGLSMRDLEPYLNGEKKGKVVGITFDDGYQNNLINALPILKKQRFTATCYGVSNLIGGTNSWDRGLVAEKPLMTLTEWQTWLVNGMDVGSHTRNHADLNQLEDAQAKEEIAGSKQDLQNLLHYEVRHFCYPYGRFNTVHKKLVANAGYQTATTTRRGRFHIGQDLYAQPRVLIAQATNMVHFLLKIASKYEDRRG